ncbi:MAG TPA: cellulose binding domain-containing protein [Pseudonocardiaceae bacterium]|nr:cellulose binding domain-containing protein [Pseudonocardiaceae bacterium]
MLSRPVTSRMGAAVAVGVALLATVATPAAAVDAASCTSTNGTTGTTSIESGEYIIQDNEWNSSAEQCVTYTSGTAWSMTTANFNLPTNGAPATYPSIYKGCHWGLCTTTNSMMPIQVSDLGTATTSWSTTQPATGAYDVAYDIWFNSTPTTPGQPNGTELMIWLNSRGGVQPFGGQTGTANLDGMNWNVWTGQQTSWKIISYVLNPGGTSFTNLDVKPLIEDAVARGSLNPAHYLIDAEAGFEIWQGGQGLGTNSFSFSATPAGAADTQSPSAPTALTVSGTTASSATLQWSPSTDNVGVTGYRVFRNGTQVGTTTATTFTDTGLTAGTQYSYTVKATDAAGNLSTPSTAASATTSAATAGGCTATYEITSQWATGFTANVTITAAAPTSAWHVTWAFPGDQQVTSMWNATSTQAGAQETATNMPYNGTLTAGQSTAFGFQASYSGTNGTPKPTCATS